tara:strand:- start:16753 stop:17586 length:834 start_codon:yes stop_codon:yes gene_type:complete
MKILYSIAECIKWRKSAHGSVGFVPTMGALHQGHLSLVKIAKKNCDYTAVSIFLNPTQFSENEDLNSYPSMLEQDIELLKKELVDAIFIPSENEIYKQKSDNAFYDTPLSKKLEGVTRPHFFKGVTMVVSRLFSIVDPTHVVFGEKDAQQLIIIKKMIEKNKSSITLISGKTIRNKHGLALSSRNTYLSTKEQKEASKIYHSLMLIKELLGTGEKNSQILKNEFIKSIKSVASFKLDYISIADIETLDETTKIKKKKTLVSTAVFFKEVRLIDNFIY